MKKIIPFLWFDGQAEEAAKLYTSVFKNAKMGSIVALRRGRPRASRQRDHRLLRDRRHGVRGAERRTAIQVHRGRVVSVPAKSQEEVDYYWNKLGEGGRFQQCGWLKDKFGLSWQIVPDRAAQAAGRPRQRQGQPRHAGDAEDEEDRHRRAGEGGRGIAAAGARRRAGGRRRNPLRSAASDQHREDQHMSKLRVHGFSISLDGYGAGPNQDLDNPLGVGGLALHGWFFATRTFQQMFGKDGGTTGIDDDFAARGFDNIGAWILGRNMFGPIRGPWPDDTWKGWWGDNPPYHCPVFVLTHHPARLDRDEGRHDLPLRHRRHPRRAEAGRRGRRRPGRPARRRRRDDPAVPAGAADRRAAPGHLAGPARLRRAPARRHRRAGLGYEVVERVPSEKAMHVVLARRG